MEINLKNKTAWVFGGSKGIGLAIAIELANAGANILLIARNKIDLQKAQDKLSVKNGQKHDVLSIDMVDTKGLVEKMRSYVNVNNVDILINNSGGPLGGLAYMADVDEYLAAFNQHVLAAQAVTQIALQSMKRNQFGRVVNIISTSVKQPISGLGVSNTIRGAMANWSKTIASEVGPFGITVNNVLPGATNTQRLVSLISKKASKNNCEEELVIKKMKNEIPVGRFADPEEIAYMVVFLCSNYASYINGINIPIDGGRTKSL
jgi:3-oxoacyl-[acyl-carrier protein] reductase